MVSRTSNPAIVMAYVRLLALSALLTVVIAAAGPVRAQPVADTPENRLAAAEALVKAQGGALEVERRLAAARPALLKLASASSPTTPPAQLAARIDKILLPTIDKYIPQILAASERAYAQLLTLNQLREIAAFYRTDAGKALLANAPALGAAAAAAYAPALREIRAEIAAQNVGGSQNAGSVNQQAP